MQTGKELPYLTFLLIAIAILLSGCDIDNLTAPVSTEVYQAPEPGKYRVKEGDTLYSIAFAFGIDYRLLLEMNNLPSNGAIHPGQYLLIKPSHITRIYHSHISNWKTYDLPLNNAAEVSPPINNKNTSVAIQPKINYSKPTIKLIPATISNSAWVWPAKGKVINYFNPGQGNKGLNIIAAAGSPIYATAAGEVVYAGTGLQAYGKLIILKHNNDYLSAYAHNQTMLVHEGDTVIKGEKIALMGNTGSQQVMLHFEIRQNGQPVDPMKYLNK